MTRLALAILNEKSQRALLNWHDMREGQYPKAKLADFLTLLDRYCKENPAVRQKITRQQVRDIRRLHGHFRNGFEHFQPQGWSIEKAGLPRIIGTALEGIELAMNHEKALHRMTGNKIRRLENNLSAARMGLAKIHR